MLTGRADNIASRVPEVSTEMHLRYRLIGDSSDQFIARLSYFTASKHKCYRSVDWYSRRKKMCV